MKGSHALAATMAALVLALVPVAALAQNADPNAKATFVSHIKIAKSKKKATLHVRYRCASGEALWVSAKELKSGDKDKALKKEGSSKVADGWWQSHRNKFVCNGKFHSAKFTIDKVEPGSKGKLRKGYAWVQFCVTKGEQTLILSKSGWVKVDKP
jgi:hypothetical protein